MGDANEFLGVRYQFINGQLNTDKFTPIKGGIRSPVLRRPWAGTFGTSIDGGGAWTMPYAGTNMEFTVPMPKVLRYSEDGEDYPSHYNPFVAIGFSYENGAAPNEQAPLCCESSVIFTYTDA